MVATPWKLSPACEICSVVGKTAYTGIKVRRNGFFTRQLEEWRCVFLPQHFSPGLSFFICRGKMRWSVGSLPILIAYKSSWTPRPEAGARSARTLSDQRCVLFPVNVCYPLEDCPPGAIVSLCSVSLSSTFPFKLYISFYLTVFTEAVLYPFWRDINKMGLCMFSSWLFSVLRYPLETVSFLKRPFM